MSKSIVTSQIQRFVYNSTIKQITKSHNIKISQLGTSSTQVSNNYCWKCGTGRGNNGIFCKKCNTIQHPQEKNNYFRILGIQEEYDINQRLLGDKYRQIQSLIHPDKFSNSTDEEQIISEEYSSLINKAYSNLLSPLKRAEHLLHLNGENITEGSDGQTIDEPSFLTKIIILNEEVEDAEGDMEKLKCLEKKNKNEMENLAKEVDYHFKNKHIEAAKKATIKLKYYSSINNRINSIFREAGMTE